MPESVRFTSIKHQNNIVVAFCFTAFNILSVSVLILCCVFPSSFILKYCIAGSLLLFILALLAKMIYTVSFNNKNFMIMEKPQEKIPRRLIIYTSDIMAVYDCSSSTANRKLKQARDHYQKQLYQDLTIKEYCNYFSIDYLETITLLKLWQ